MFQNQWDFKIKDIKNKLLAIWDSVLIVFGVIIIVIGAIEWNKTGFELKPKYLVGRNDGNEAVGLMIIGIGISVYGLIDYYFFRKKRNCSQKSKK